MIRLLGAVSSGRLFANAGQAEVERKLNKALAGSGRARLRLAVTDHEDDPFERVAEFFAPELAAGTVELYRGDLTRSDGADELFAGVDGVMCHGQPDVLLRQGLLDRCPVALHLHSFELLPEHRSLLPMLVRPGHYRYLPFLFAPSQCTAQRAAAVFRSATFRVLSTPRIHVLTHAVDQSLADGSRERGRARLGVDGRTPLILSLNRISRQKADYRQLLFALATLIETTEFEPELRLVGGVSPDDLPDLERLRSIATALGIAERLEIVPHLAEADKADVLAAADVCVILGNNPQESFGLSVLEGQIAGRSIVASDWNGYREVIAPELADNLVPTWSSHEVARKVDWLALHGSLSLAATNDLSALTQTLTRCLRGGPEVERERAIGRAHARAFTWERVAGEALDVWDEVLADPQARGPAPMGDPPRSPVDGLATHELAASTRVRLAGAPSDASERARMAAARVAEFAARTIELLADVPDGCTLARMNADLELEPAELHVGVLELLAVGVLRVG